VTLLYNFIKGDITDRYLTLDSTRKKLNYANMEIICKECSRYIKNNRTISKICTDIDVSFD